MVMIDQEYIDKFTRITCLSSDMAIQEINERGLDNVDDVLDDFYKAGESSSTLDTIPNAPQNDDIGAHVPDETNDIDSDLEFELAMSMSLVNVPDETEDIDNDLKLAISMSLLTLVQEMEASGQEKIEESPSCSGK